MNNTFDIGNDSTNRKPVSSPISIPIKYDKSHTSDATKESDVRRFQLATLIMHQRIMFHRIRLNQKPMPLSFHEAKSEHDRDCLTFPENDRNHLTFSEHEGSKHGCDSNFVIFNLDVDDFKE